MSETPQGGNGNQGQTLSIGRQCSDHLRSYVPDFPPVFFPISYLYTRISPLHSFLFLTYIHVFPPSILSYFLLIYTYFPLPFIYIHVFPPSLLSYFRLTCLSLLANIDSNVAKGTTDQDLCTLTSVIALPKKTFVQTSFSSLHNRPIFAKTMTSGTKAGHHIVNLVSSTTKVTSRLEHH